MDAVAAPTLASPATPPVLRLVVLAVQHVLVMHAVAVAVPLILGGALRLPREQVALLINADLFACGVATIIQSRGIGPVGIRILSTVDFEARGNPVVVAVSIGCGTIPLVAPTLFHAAPDMLRTLPCCGRRWTAASFWPPLPRWL